MRRSDTVLLDQQEDDMKLAEALQVRADIQRRLQQLRQRIALSARTQEGETPPEDPNELLAEAGRLLDQLETLITGINRTNVATQVEPELTLTDALARRDVLQLRRAILVEAANNASVRQDRFTHSELRVVAALDVAELHRQADVLAKRCRELDAKIQEVNWLTELAT
jgi:uncharacterized protein DUF6847